MYNDYKQNKIIQYKFWIYNTIVFEGGLQKNMYIYPGSGNKESIFQILIKNILL